MPVGMPYTHWTSMNNGRYVVLYITAWASALLVPMMWAMRRPQAVERATCTDSHAFFVYSSNESSGEKRLSNNLYERLYGICLLYRTTYRDWNKEWTGKARTYHFMVFSQAVLWQKQCLRHIQKAKHWYRTAFKNKHNPWKELLSSLWEWIRTQDTGIRCELYSIIILCFMHILFSLY